MSHPHPPQPTGPPNNFRPDFAAPQGGYPHPQAGAWPPPPAPYPAQQQPAPAYPGYPGHPPAPGVAAAPGYGHPYAGGYPAGYNPWGPRPATLMVRWVGWFLDSWGITAAFYVGGGGAALLGFAVGLPDDAVSILALVGVVLAIAFYVVGTTTIWGRTPGKMLAGTQVVDIHTGQPPGLGRALLRTLVLAPFWVLWPLVLIPAALATNREDKRTWWDLAGRTRVIVYVRPQR